MGPFAALNPFQLFGSARRVLAAATRKIRPDHRAISGRVVAFPATDMRRFYLAVAVAPSRSATRRYDNRQPVRARAFAVDAFPEIFDETPTHADRETTVFSTQTRDGVVERALYVHRTGLIEVLWALTPYVNSDDHDGGFSLDSAEIAAVTARLADAVARPPYAEVSRAGHGRRRFARMDWWLNLTAYVDHGDMTRAWAGLTFPNSEPRRASNSSPAASFDGFGLQRIRNRRRRAPARQITRELLEELLSVNGYYEYAPAIDAAVTAGQALHPLPSPTPLPAGDGPAPTDDQVRVLDAVYEHFRSDGRRVPFRTLDKELDLEGLELRSLADTMPTGLLLPIVSSRGGFYRDDDDLFVTARGLKYCEHGDDALELLAHAMGYLARRERPFIPDRPWPELRVTSTDFEHALSLEPFQVRWLQLMLHDYEPHAWTQLHDDENGPWSLTIACEYIRRFRGVDTTDQYLRTLDGESCADQSDAPQTTPRFVLSADTNSPDLTGEQPIALRIDNYGPTEVLEAVVVSIENAEAPTPWQVRWRDTPEPAREILAGGHWMLELARCDALHGAHAGAWRPGFRFLKPDNQEIFVAHAGVGEPGSHYGTSMQVHLRVSPRSSAARALDIVVLLQITQDGLNVVWQRSRVAPGAAT